MVYYVMGVSGSGKTTIGEMLAQQLSLPFFDADDFHPPENIKKMESGHALTDDDRKGWLKAIRAKAVEQIATGQGAVITCSALKEKYRVQLSDNIKNSITWIYLDGEFDLIKERMEERSHFMPVSLLESQFKTLEEPTYGVRVSIDQTPEQIIKEITSKL